MRAISKPPSTGTVIGRSQLPNRTCRRLQDISGRSRMRASTDRALRMRSSKLLGGAADWKCGQQAANCLLALVLRVAFRAASQMPPDE